LQLTEIPSVICISPHLVLFHLDRIALVRRRFLIFFSIYLLAGLYVADALVNGLHLAGPYRFLAGLTILLLALAMPLTWFLRGRLPRAAMLFCYVVGGYYIAWLVWGVLDVFAVDMVRVFAWAAGIGIDPALGRTVALAIIATIALMTAYGTLSAARMPRIRHVDIPVADLPEHLEGLTIAHLSDLHLGFVHRVGRLRRVVEAVNGEEPDLIVLTGDQADGEPDEFLAGVGLLRELSASRGVFAVNGNHEHYGNAPLVDAELARVGITVLSNAWTEVSPGLVVAGMEDPTGGNADLERTLEGIPPEATVVLLVHQPHYFDLARTHRVALTLSGHTHGGQFWPWCHVVKRFHTYVAGHYRHGNSHLYVSNGIGTWGPFMRVGAPPELPIYRLCRAGVEPVSRRGRLFDTRMFRCARRRRVREPVAE